MSVQSATISVSNPTLNCNDIYKEMLKLKIPCKISKNNTISREGKPENGCEIFIPDCTRDILQYTIWTPLQKQHKFKCAHLDIPNKYNGCIHDFFRHVEC